MSAPLAIIAGEGRLPQVLAETLGLENVLWVTIGEVAAPPGVARLSCRVERLGEMFEALRARGVREVVFAGAMRRPPLDPARADPLALRLAAHFASGDDTLLRAVLELFDEQGFAVRGAAGVAPQLTLPDGTLWGHAPTPRDRADAAKARQVLEVLAPLDIAQGAVAAGGLMLGIETLQGTAALLDFVARTDLRLKSAPGVFVKRPKLGQEGRLDTPTIGPKTIRQVAEAGLSGLVIAAGGVLVLDMEKTRAAVEDSGLFLLAEA